MSTTTSSSCVSDPLLDTPLLFQDLPFADLSFDSLTTSLLSRPSFPCITFFSLNVNKANYIGHAVLNSFVDSADVILFQEPWKGRIGTSRSNSSPDGTSIYGMVHQRSWTSYIPVPGDVGKDSPARVAAYVSRARPDIVVRQRTDIISHPDILALELSAPRRPPFLVINVYNDANCSALTALMSSTLPDLPTIITGDFNLHHEAWAMEESTPSSAAEPVVEWLENKGFSLLNQPGEVTFDRAGQLSVLDLTWVSKSALDLDLVRDWAIRHDLNICSDHFPTVWHSPTGHNPPPTDNLPRFRFNPDRMEEWMAVFDSVASPLFTQEFLSSEDVTNDILEEAVSVMDRAMVEASSRTMKAPHFKQRISPWFTQEVKAAISRARAAHRHLRLARTQSPQTLRWAGIAYRVARRKVRRVVAKAKRDWALHFAGDVATRDVWKLTSWYKGVRRHTVPHLTRPDGSTAVSSEDKCPLFHQTFFPPPPPVHVDDFNPALPRENTRPFVDVTPQEVENCLKKTSNKSAPGYSGVSYQAIKWVWAIHPDWLMFVIKWSLRLGVHNDRWKRSVTVVLPKPGKPRYDTPKSYRPIQLLECLGKLVEKIVAKRITYDCGKYNILPPEQFGGRSSSSCVDAGLSLVHDIEHAWKRGLVASVLAIDIKGFFDHVNRRRLIRILWEAGFPIPIVRWVESFLTDRQAAVKVDGYIGDMLPVHNGIPQGSPISPILSVLYSAGIILEIREATDLVTFLGIPLLPRSYIDDFAILVISESIVDNVRVLSEGLDRLISLLGAVGMTIDPDKLDLIHFSKRPGNSIGAHSVTCTVDGQRIVVEPKKVMRWLGIFFDTKLTFSEHVKIMSNRARSIINGLRCLSNTIRGLSQSHLRILYKTCVIPVMTYASAVWYRTEKRQLALIKSLEVTQNKALRLISGGFRTSPTLSIQALSHVPPIRLTLERLSSGAAIRLSKLPLSSLVSQRLPNAWRDGQPPSDYVPFPPLDVLPHSHPSHFSIIESLSSRSSPHAERCFPYSDLCAPHFVNPLLTSPSFSTRIEPTSDPDSRRVIVASINRRLIRSSATDLSFFCDGSRKRCGEGKKRSGLGVVIYRGNTIQDSISVGLGRRSSVFDAEMFALALSAKRALELVSSGDVTSISFYSDSASALRLITSTNVHPSQVASFLFVRRVSQILSDFPHIQISLEWSPGHAGVIGNEKADSAAKAGTRRPPVLYPTIAYFKAKANSSINRQWRKTVKSRTPSSGTEFLNHFPITRTPIPFFRSTDREIYGRVTQTLTGHGYTGEYYAKRVPSESPWCPCSSAGAPILMTRLHILRECNRYASHRHILTSAIPDLMDPSWSPAMLGEIKRALPALATFLKSSGAFTKLGTPFRLNLILPPPRDPRPP